MGDDEIVINQWLADDLHAKPGGLHRSELLFARIGAKLTEANYRFRIHSIVPLELPWAIAHACPSFLESKICGRHSRLGCGVPAGYRIRPKTTILEGTSRHTEGVSSRWRQVKDVGQSIRERNGHAFSDTYRHAHRTVLVHFQRRLLTTLKPEELGCASNRSGTGRLRPPTNHRISGQLFIGFSIFLVAAALLLMPSCFNSDWNNVHVEIGTLLALGSRQNGFADYFSSKRGAAFLGAAIGAVGGLGYAKNHDLGLTTLWKSAVANSSHAIPCEADFP